MEMSPQKQLQMLAYEAFIRRAARVKGPFMLKGSYVTRQYFADPALRLPNDLDWVCTQRIASMEEANTLFNDWVTAVTEWPEDDGVAFISFTENAFWRRIDYAMDDDFPTVNTDLVCWIDGEKFDWFSLDISFNLDVEVPPVPLLYQPLRGGTFLVPSTVPLALQVSWKLHQTLVRPRFKDLFDLTHLLVYPGFGPTVREQALQALVNECSADRVDTGLMQWFLTGNMQPLFREINVTRAWEYWRFGTGNGSTYDYSEGADQLTDADALPERLVDFLNAFRVALAAAGFSPEVLAQLPSPTRHKRPGNVHTAPPVAPAAPPEVPPGPPPPTGGTWRDVLLKWFR
jgi:hypothetical protein